MYVCIYIYIYVGRYSARLYEQIREKVLHLRGRRLPHHDGNSSNDLGLFSFEL